MTPEYHIEIGAEPTGGCPCCDPDAAAPQGFLLHAGAAHAIYYADWLDNGPVTGVDLVVATGRWDADSGPQHRHAAAFRLNRTGTGADIVACDAGASRWRDLALLGRLLAAGEVPAEMAEIARFVADADPRIRAALRRTVGSDYRLSLGRGRAKAGANRRI